VAVVAAKAAGHMAESSSASRFTAGALILISLIAIARPNS
jgi:hypothetical protein